MKLKKIIVILVILTCAVSFSDVATGKEAVVFYAGMAEQGHMEAERVKLACDLLGIQLVTHLINTKNSEAMLRLIGELRDTEALILSSEVAQYLYKGNVPLFGKGDKKRNILISGIDSETNVAYLKQWSGNKVRRFRGYQLSGTGASMKVIENKEITKELGGLDHPVSIAASSVINGFEVEESGGAASLIEVGDVVNNVQYSIFVQNEFAGESIFLLSDWNKVIANEKEDLVKLLPLLIFLKYSFGERCWHRVDDVANFTIDDPWIREPYGYVSFARLCEEAKRTRFHVTVGFIPYNYKKSHDDAVEIFRKCSENLSLAVHGNNHDFTEFRSEESNRVVAESGWEMVRDEKSILQALHRMEEFRRITKVSWDRVMIFPRGAFTKENLGLLKKHDFLMTVNSTRPSNSGGISDQVDRIRGITFEFGSFPMLIRDGISGFRGDKRAAAIAEASIRMRFFLDLPVLLYTHHTDFKDGMDKLNSVAGTVNRIQPNVVWAGLGDVSNRLYLQRKIDEREFEILAFSNELVVGNNYDVPFRFVIRKQEDFAIPIQSVAVDGIEHEYGSEDNHIRIVVYIEPGGRKTINITYNSGRSNGITFNSDRSIHAFFVRILSDFRDIYLSKLPFGDRIVDGFYWVGGIRSSVIGLGALAAALLIVFALCRKKRLKDREIHKESSLEL